MRKLSKKGFGESLLLIISIFIIAIFLIIFIAKYSVSTDKKIRLLNENLADIENKLILVNYLRTPVPQKEGIVAEYLAQGVLDEVEPITREIMEKNQFNSWRLRIKIKNQIKEIHQSFYKKGLDEELNEVDSGARDIELAITGQTREELKEKIRSDFVKKDYKIIRTVIPTNSNNEVIEVALNLQ